MPIVDGNGKLTIVAGMEMYPCSERGLYDLVRFTWEEHVHHLTVGRPSAQLLHLGYLGLEVGVDPGQHLVPGEILIGHRGVEHIDGHPQTETDTDCQLAARFLPQSQCGRLISAPQLGHFLPWHCTRYHSHCSGLVGLPW